MSFEWGGCVGVRDGTVLLNPAYARDLCVVYPPHFVGPERLAILHAGSEVGAAEVQALLAGTPGSARRARPGGTGDDPRSLAERLDDHERELIAAALEGTQGNVAEAARKLRTDRANLYRRMRRLGMER